MSNPGLGNTFVVVAAIAISVLALIVAAMRPPVVVNAPGGPGSAEDATLYAINPFPGCAWNDTATEFFPHFWYVNEGNRTARNTVVNLTYRTGAPPIFVAYQDVPLGDIPPHSGGYVDLGSTWVQWGRDVCGAPFEFRVSFTWDS